MKVDHLIIGQGIAGSMMAHFLLRQGRKIMVVDAFNPNSSSQIAAGIVNPVTGHRMVKSWMIDELLPFAKKKYRELEEELKTRFFFEQDIYKLFPATEERKIWERKQGNSEFDEYLGEIVEEVDRHVLSPYGAGIIKKGCWMDVPLFIKKYRELLKEKGCLLEETLQADSIGISEKISYKHMEASSVIYCEGYHAHRNPLFDFVPFSIAKGEQFLVHAPDLNLNKILNRNIFILPKGNDLYSVGSTFVWDDLEESVTDSGREEIITRLQKIISCPYKIVEEKAGIRPTIKDRRPVIGNHPVLPNVFIFNGMGTKGVSLAPYFAHHFAADLSGQSCLPHEVSAKRFIA
jgi:glycine/D-amino acid oxidase-like deaminating enzyme